MLYLNYKFIDYCIIINHWLRPLVQETNILPLDFTLDIIGHIFQAAYSGLFNQL